MTSALGSFAESSGCDRPEDNECWVTSGKEPAMGRTANSFKNFIQGPGEMAQELRVHAVPAKDQNLVSRTFIRWPTCKSSSRGSDALSSGLQGHQHSRAHPPSLPYIQKLNVIKANFVREEGGKREKRDRTQMVLMEKVPPQVLSETGEKAT